VTAFCASDGGSAGPTAATGCGAGVPCAAGGAGGATVVVWPLRLVTVTVLVTLLITTVLWTLL
jgi:hypothetical protein